MDALHTAWSHNAAELHAERVTPLHGTDPKACAGDRPQTHPAIAVVGVAIMLNRHYAARRMSASRRFRDDSGYTFGYTGRQQEALSQGERASDLLRRW